MKSEEIKHFIESDNISITNHTMLIKKAKSQYCVEILNRNDLILNSFPSEYLFREKCHICMENF